MFFSIRKIMIMGNKIAVKIPYWAAIAPMTPNPQIPKGYFFSFLIAPLFCNPISSPSPDYAQSHFFRPLVESGMNTVHYRNLNFKSAIFLAKFQVLFFYDRPRQYISISIFFSYRDEFSYSSGYDKHASSNTWYRHSHKPTIL